MSDWRKLPGDDLEAQYNPRRAVPDFEQHFETYKTRSAETRARIGGAFDLRYGPTPLQTYDLHEPAKANGTPLVVLIHGGYWRGLDKSLHSFVAEPYLAAGAVVANINYDLCPAVTVDEIVRQVQACIAHLAREAPSFGADPARLHVMGHSAGAHLAAAAFALPWDAAALGPRPQPAGFALVSGVYDLEPVLHITVNQDVRLDGAMAKRNSLLRQPLKTTARTLIAVGDAEPDAWIGQSEEFHAACRAAGTPANLMRIASANHFSILYAMADAKHPLTAEIIKQF